MHRRTFLKTSGSALTSAWIVQRWQFLQASAAAPPKRDLKKAFMLACFGGNLALAEKFKILKRAGFDGVEPMSGLSRDEVLKARDDAQLEIPSVCCSTHWSVPLSDPNPSVREKGLAGLCTALEDAKHYGAKSVLLVPALVNANVSYAEAYERSQAEIAKALPIAAELKVKIAIENVWNHFLLSPIEAARYVDEFHNEWVAWHFDVGNVINYGWPEQWIRILGKRIAQLHIKEFSRKRRDEKGLREGFNVDYLEGDNNWPAVMKALDETGYTGWGIAEPPGQESLEQLTHVARKMDEIFAL